MSFWFNGIIFTDNFSSPLQCPRHYFLLYIIFLFVPFGTPKILFQIYGVHLVAGYGYYRSGVLFLLGYAPSNYNLALPTA